MTEIFTDLVVYNSLTITEEEMYLILATTNGFNFELNSSLKESMGVRSSLTVGVNECNYSL